MTAEQFAAEVPFHENEKFEWKASPTLSNPKFDFELGKQVSAFANSGGGYIVLGIANDRSFDPLPNVRKRPTQKDWLVGKVNRCVDFPIKDFKVHPLPMADDPERAVFVIEVADSLSAPHLAVDEKRYYYRLDGRSEIAPHFYVNLLFSRTTKAVLRVSDIRFNVGKPSVSQHTTDFNFQFTVEVENTSMQAATSWGVVVSDPTQDSPGWKISSGMRYYSFDKGLCVHGQNATLLPLDRKAVDFYVSYQRYGTGATDIRAIENVWSGLGMEIIPVSHNSAGEPFRYGYWQDDVAAWSRARSDLRNVWDSQ